MNPADFRQGSGKRKKSYREYCRIHAEFLKLFFFFSSAVFLAWFKFGFSLRTFVRTFQFTLVDNDSSKVKIQSESFRDRRPKCDLS